MPELLIQRPVGECIDLAEAKLHLRVTEASQDDLIRALLGGARSAAEMITRNQLLHARWQLVLDRFPMAGIGTPLPFAETVNIPGYAVMLPHAPVTDVVSVQYLDMSGTLQTMPSSDWVLNRAMRPAILTPGFGKIWPISLPQIGAVQITYNAGYASPMKVVGSSGPQFAVTGPVSWKVGDQVEFYNSGGKLPGGIAAATPYLIATAPGGNVYTLTELAGGGITFTDAGGGSSFIGVVPDGLRNWVKLRVASLYQNREEVAILNRGQVQELPFIDGLLDEFRISLP